MNRFLAFCILVCACLGQTAHADSPAAYALFNSTCALGELADDGTNTTGPVFDFTFADFPFTFHVERARCTVDTTKSFLRIGMTSASGFEKRPRVAIVQDGVELGYFGFSLNDLDYRTANGFSWERCNFDCTNIYGSGFAGIKPWPGVSFSPQRAFQLVAKVQDGRTVTMNVPAAPASGVPPLAAQARGLWWNPDESGWGLLMDRNLDGIVFANWYTFDVNGEPTWFAMPNGRTIAPNVVVGDVYWPQGPTAFTEYDAKKFVPGEPVGRFRIEFIGNTAANFHFDVLGRSGTKAVVPMKFRYGPNNDECTHLRGAWWDPAQNGIGVGFEGSIGGTNYPVPSRCPVHAVWSTYNAEGRPTWYFSGLFDTAPTAPFGYPPLPIHYAGPLHQVRGPFFGGAYQASQVVVSPPLGEWRLEFNPAGELVPTITSTAGTYRSTLRRFNY